MAKKQKAINEMIHLCFTLQLPAQFSLKCRTLYSKLEEDSCIMSFVAFRVSNVIFLLPLVIVNE